MPLTVCSGQRHPGSCQRQQTHPLQVSDPSTGRMGWGNTVPGLGTRLSVQWYLGKDAHDGGTVWTALLALCLNQPLLTIVYLMLFRSQKL